MRHGTELTLIAAVAAFALTGVVATWMVLGAHEPPVHAVDPGAVSTPPSTIEPTPDAAAWFGAFRAYCNPVDVDTRMRWHPAPSGVEGDMYEAACYALAGRIDRAREVVLGMPAESRYRAAGVVFEAGHPAADAGDEIAAGPLMELVVEFWPNHYMALYHAGAAAFERGDHDAASGYLERFLAEYAQEDGWRADAVRMLDEMALAES